MYKEMKMMRGAKEVQDKMDELLGYLSDTQPDSNNASEIMLACGWLSALLWICGSDEGAVAALASNQRIKP